MGRHPARPAHGRGAQHLKVGLGHGRPLCHEAHRDIRLALDQPEVARRLLLATHAEALREDHSESEQVGATVDAFAGEDLRRDVRPRPPHAGQPPSGPAGEPEVEQLDTAFVREADVPGMEDKTPADSKVAGYGRIDGRPVAVVSNDFTVLAASTSRVAAPYS